MAWMVERTGDLLAQADRVLDVLKRHPYGFGQAMDAFLQPLRQAHLEWDQGDFAGLTHHLREHPLCAQLHTDPLTWRSYAKPRGYGADPVALDYIYGPQHAPLPRLNALARQVFRYTTQSPSAAALRYRRDILAGLVERTARRHLQTVNVLAVGCGHLREAAAHPALAAGKVRWWAIDHDADNLRVVENDYGAQGVRPVQMDVDALLQGHAPTTGAELIYLGNALDQLDDQRGQRLLGQLFDRLAPGGELVCSSFLPGHADCGYRACYMDWHVQCRDLDTVHALGHALPQGQIERQQQWQDLAGSIAFVGWRKSSH